MIVLDLTSASGESWNFLAALTTRKKFLPQMHAEHADESEWI